jgi:hypothetical protein
MQIGQMRQKESNKKRKKSGGHFTQEKLSRDQLITVDILNLQRTAIIIEQ